MILKKRNSLVLYNIEKESLIMIKIVIISDGIMGICPYCKQHIVLNDVEIEKKGKGIVEQDRMYVCPVCDYILGFSYAMR